MAYGAGSYAKQLEVSDRFPYWEYSTAEDERVRASHRALHGKIFRAEDKQFYPPIGFNCRCRAIPVSKSQAEKRGITGPDTITPEMQATLGNAEFIGNKVKLFEDWLTEKMTTIDPVRRDLIRSKITELSADAIEQIQDITTHDIESRLAEIKPETSDIDHVNIFLNEFSASIGTPATHIDSTKTKLLINDDIFIDRSTGTYKVGKGRKKYVMVLADAIKDPDEIWESDNREKRLYLRMGKKANGETGGAIVVYKKIGKVWKGSTAFFSKDTKYLEKQRQGKRIYKKKEE